MENIFQILSTVPDHRRGNHLIYPIDYLLLISFSGIMSGFTTWSDFELYAQLHEEDLKMLYKRLAKRELMNYTPSHDTFSYCFRGLDPKAFQEAFKSWLLTVYEILGEHICIDGKTIRGVRKLDPDSDSHTVTAYIAGIRASLNQVFISKKSNEINAVKELLDVIDVEGNILTIDAIGTQKEIVDKIVSKKGEYILQVKSNQPGTLLELEVAKRPTASSVRIISPGLYWNLKSIFVPSTRMKLSQQRVWNRGMAEWKLANLRA